MSETYNSKTWLYISFVPSIIATLGLTLVISARLFQWGVESDIPAEKLLGLFFAEITMVASGLGIASYLKSPHKTARVNRLGLWNLLMLITSAVIGYNLFNTM